MKQKFHIAAWTVLTLFSLSCQANPKPSVLKTLKHWSHSCQQLVKDDETLWKHVCQRWHKHPAKTEAAAETFLKQNFKPIWHTAEDTLITGYYAPVIHGCKHRSKQCDTPLLDLSDAKLQSLSRKQINRLDPKKLSVLSWTSRSDRFFLQIQGSGILRFKDKSELHLGYAGKNEYPYSSIGHYLDEHAMIDKEALNMTGIKRYLKQNPKEAQGLLERNQSFVFFQKQQQQGVIGNLGVPLQKERSAAVDKNKIPLGAILWVTTTDPLHYKPWELLLVAQDTGSAINGRNHIDVYMGTGKNAGLWAGKMHQGGKIMYYLPRKSAKASK